MNRNFWNDRYTSNVTVYGQAPNTFFRDQLSQLTPGKLLLPAEGEGRNAIFAASKGWEAHAFDFSEAARTKALGNALKADVTIRYEVADITTITLPENEYDAIGVIYVHLPESERRIFHHKLVSALKPTGTLILEVFSKEQLGNPSGGPKDAGLLYSLDELREDFRELSPVLAGTFEIVLDEGAFHKGPANVIRFVGSKEPT